MPLPRPHSKENTRSPGSGKTHGSPLYYSPGTCSLFLICCGKAAAAANRLPQPLFRNKITAPLHGPVFSAQSRSPDLRYGAALQRSQCLPSQISPMANSRSAPLGRFGLLSRSQCRHVSDFHRILSSPYLPAGRWKGTLRPIQFVFIIQDSPENIHAFFGIFSDIPTLILVSSPGHPQ